MGLAVGAMGMCLDDFLGMTPGEFGAVHEAWEGCRRQSWERARLVGWCAVAPHVSRRMGPEEFLPFPWEGKGDSSGLSASSGDGDGLTDAERLRRFEAAKERYGLG